MTSSLLRQFLAEECTPHVRRLLEDAIADTATSHARFEFNRFEVTIKRDSKMAILEDALDATEAGVQRLPLAEFANAVVGEIYEQRSDG